jgi:molybdate transport system substrate-binding protein
MALVLLLSAAIPSFAAGESVSVSSHSLKVNGEAADVFAAYTINGENYLKIRDVALLLKGSTAEFSIEYASGTVAITTGSPYVPNGTESTAKPLAYKAFEASTDVVTIDGAAVGFTVYKIDGSNYFRLRDFANVGAYATFNSATSTADLLTIPDENAALLIHAAASLKATFEKSIAEFTALYPNVKIETNFGGSGALATQIREGGGDMFFSADEANMNKVDDLIITDSRTDLLKNTLVLIVPKGNPKGITSFEDVVTKVGKSGIVAIGEAKSVPAGDRAREVYEHLGLTAELNALTLTLGSDVGKVRAYVESGEADVGFVYATDALASGDKVEIIATAPDGSHAPIVYPGAVLSECKSPDTARAFLAFLGSDSVRSIFTAAGFTIA